MVGGGRLVGVAIGLGIALSSGAWLVAPTALARTERSSKVETEQYAITWAPLGAAKLGQPATARLTFAAKGDFKVNQQFPLKLKLEKPPTGVTFSQSTLGREEAKLEEKSGTLDVAFIASEKGPHKLTGTFSVSFCSDKTCLMEKIQLEVSVNTET